MTALIFFAAFGAITSAMLLFLVVGIRSPARHECEVSEEYAVPLSVVMNAVANVSAYPSWRPSVRTVELVSQRPESFVEVGRRRSTTYIVDEEVATPDRLAKRVHRIAAANARFTGQWIFGFEAIGNRTRLTIIEQGEVLNPLLRGMASLFYSPTKTMMQYLIDLRGHLEMQQR